MITIPSTGTRTFTGLRHTHTHGHKSKGTGEQRSAGKARSLVWQLEILSRCDRRYCTYGWFHAVASFSDF